MTFEVIIITLVLDGFILFGEFLILLIRLHYYSPFFHRIDFGQCDGFFYRNGEKSDYFAHYLLYNDFYCIKEEKMIILGL